MFVSKAIWGAALCAVFVVCPVQAKLDVQPDGTDVVGVPVSVDDAAQFADNDAEERMLANVERFGGALSEDDKLALLQLLQQQSQLYGIQLAGGRGARGVPAWKSIGPTSAKYQTNGVTLNISDSGRINTILQSPVDADTVYVLTSGGGLWKTKTFGKTNPRWEAKTDALLSTSGGSVALGRAPETLYLGIGDFYDGISGLGGLMAKSTDGGDTWLPLVTLSGATTVRDVKVDTSGGTDVVLVATDVGLFRSIDGGISYAKVAAIPGQGFWSIVRTSAGWLASSGWSTTYTGLPVVGRLLLSSDHGATWAVAGSGFTNAGRSTLAVATDGDATVYAYAASPDGRTQRDLFRSNDGGFTFAALNVTAKVPTNPNYFQATMNLMAGQAFYNQLILVDPSDASRNTVYLGGQLATAKTVDGGATWTQISTWLPYAPLNVNLPYVHADCHFATYLNINGSRGLAFGTDGGLFVSGDGGASWDFSKNDGIVSFLTQTVASSSKNRQDVISGLQDTGSRARLGSSGVYNQVTGGDGEGVGWSEANNAFTVTSVPGAIYTSHGLLPNTTFDYFSRTGLRSAFFFTPIETPSAVLDPTGQIFLSATGSGVIATFNGGTNWVSFARIGSRLPFNFSIRGTWHTVGLNRTVDGIAVGGTGGRVAISPDYINYTVRALICPSPSCVPGFRGFIAAPVWAPGGMLYIASESQIPGSVHVVRSTDQGVTWSARDAGLPGTPVYHLVVDPSDASGGTLYAGTSIGVYKTVDGGENWALFGSGMPTTPIRSLSISTDGRVLRAASYGRGLWEINL